MGKTISIHSFRGGTGKSNTSANLCYALAAAGKKVCVIDTDIQSPGIHVPLGVTTPPKATLNDFLWGKEKIENVAMDISGNMGLSAGRAYLIPCSMNMGEITRILKEGYDVGLLNRGFREVSSKLGLDYLIIDTHPGLNEETLLSIAISDVLFIIMRPDKQDFQGTSVTVEVARKLKVKHLYIILNKVLSYYDPAQLTKEVEGVYNAKVATVLQLSEKLVELGSSSLFVREHPDEQWSKGVKAVADLIIREL